jgi:formamidopyrimidine-DNA glycosylase
MPELPEVETIKNQLAEKITGKKIVRVEILRASAFKSPPEKLAGRKIKRLQRIGKMIVIGLDNGTSLLVHLKMSGQISVYENMPDEIHKHVRVFLHFSDKSVLEFRDLRTFGWMKIVEDKRLKTEDFNLGKEPWDMAEGELFGKLKKIGRPIKVALLDQAVVSGGGNIYVNDSLWEAGVKPDRVAKTLSPEEGDRIQKALVKVLREGIKYGGSSAKDEGFVWVNGESGKYQNHFRVYERAGEVCKRCGGKIKKIKLGGRGTYFCPECQR